MRKSRFSDSHILSILKQKYVRKPGGKVLKPSQRKEMAIKIVGRYQVSIKFDCICTSISEICYYKPKLGDANDLVAKKLVELTTEHKRWGFGLCYSYLRNVLNYKWNHKCIYRIYKELELNLRIKPRKRLKRDKPEALAVLPTQNNAPIS